MKSCWSFLFFGFAVQAFAAAPLYHRQTERLQASQIGSRTLGDWLPNNKTAIQHWVNTKASEAKRHHNGTLEPVIQDFKLAIESDPALSRYADQMFVEVPNKYKAPYNETPVGNPELGNFSDFLILLDHIIHEGPGWFDKRDPTTPSNSSSIVPILLRPTLATKPGISTSHSPYGRPRQQHKDPEYHVDPTLVVDNACESAPLQVRHNASLFDYFFLKEQPYSLTNMLNFHPLANTFVGGIVYQAYLSTLSYHRWHAPFSGRIVHIENVPGTYYSGNLFTGLAETAYTGQAPDDSAPNYSQPYISAVATRGIVYIQARNPAIGLMAIVFVGMGEVSSCEFTVHVGQEVNKGDQLGMFHFGGSTHVMVFQPGVELDFVNPIPHGDVASGSFLSETNFAVRSALAVVRT
ncbi:hypothetical protein D0859_11805 [Hortaea werneckii]|uniref:L-tryptophan decarboxylase PsiD-like domain-containing protein n=1 Tax=Hortaea werneckii TaxID=91943 RepID=A0A3M7IF23_HORWE|nr:hypothetical protein D0859_11805 [Hortaea werneckii]